jgi:hypothetical protein
MFRKCGSLDVSKFYGLPLPVAGITLTLKGRRPTRKTGNIFITLSSSGIH